MTTKVCIDLCRLRRTVLGCQYMYKNGLLVDYVSAVYGPEKNAQIWKF